MENGDKCFLAFHPSQNTLHNANVLKVEFVDGEWRCLVRYISTIRVPSEDVWLTKDRVMEPTMENLLKQQALEIEAAEIEHKLYEKAKAAAKKEKIESELVYGLLRKEFEATYGAQAKGFVEYMIFHKKERAKAPGERRAKPDGGFRFERALTEEELCKQKTDAEFTRAARIFGLAQTSRILKSWTMPKPYERKTVYSPYKV